MIRLMSPRGRERRERRRFENIRTTGLTPYATMAFDSLVEALASSAETADKIKFAAGYVGTYFVAFTIIC